MYMETAADGTILSSGYRLQIKMSRWDMPGHAATECNRFIHALQDTARKADRASLFFQGVEIDVVIAWTMLSRMGLTIHSELF
jgi:hypothetical protein